MPQFVIGVSGVTCGGKTTLTQLLRRTFPGCRVLHQDAYFYDDDDPHHVRLPDVENHVNYELLTAMDMDKMHEDVAKLVGEKNNSNSELPGYVEGNEDMPFFEGHELLKNTADLDLGDAMAKHKDVSILLIEGYLIFASDYVHENCDIRFYLSLDEKECSKRRSERTTYTPPDVPGYFEKCVWVEYLNHFENCIKKKKGIHIIDGSTPIEEILKTSVDLIVDSISKKFPI